MAANTPWIHPAEAWLLGGTVAEIRAPASVTQDAPKAMVGWRHRDVSIQRSGSSMTEAEASDLVWQAIDVAGGTRSIYRNPRQAFSAQSRRLVEVGTHTVEIRYG